jgi:hypothetical protein
MSILVQGYIFDRRETVAGSMSTVQHENGGFLLTTRGWGDVDHRFLVEYRKKRVDNFSLIVSCSNFIGKTRSFIRPCSLPRRIKFKKRKRERTSQNDEVETVESGGPIWPRGTSIWWYRSKNSAPKAVISRTNDWRTITPAFTHRLSRRRAWGKSINTYPVAQQQQRAVWEGQGFFEHVIIHTPTKKNEMNQKSLD